MRCLELFAGAGGAALGLERAGFEHAALVEWDPAACATLRAAGLGPVVEGDVRDLDRIAEVERAGWRSEDSAWQIAGDALLDVDPPAGSGPDGWGMMREELATMLLDAGRRIDLLWSSFPCQAWSQAGHQKGAEDERNGWPWTVDAVDRFRPTWFLAENVRGLLSHSAEHCGNPQKCPGCYFEGVILPELRARFAHVGWWLLDAADYGVPQHRRRVIIWAGPGPVEKPEPTHGDGLLPYVPMRAACDWTACRSCGGCGEQRTALGFAVRCSHCDGDGTQRPTGKQGDQAASQPWMLDKPAPAVVCSEEKGRRVGTGSTPDAGNGGPAKLSDALYLATGQRRPTPEQCAAVQGFPPEHPWRGTTSDIYRQTGNAVPPTLAEVCGRAVVRAALKTPSTSTP
jgi:DNA (cytosine-5)-methyltransferase 1